MGSTNLTYTALFTETAKTYRIRFYSGSSIVQQSLVPYGEMPVYSGATPTKATDEHGEYEFARWSPEIAPVTGQADYYAEFSVIFSLASVSWARISEISAEGTGENYFSIGECKGVPIKGTVGTLEVDATYFVYILGFNHNSEIEGNGITFGTFKSAAKEGKDVAFADAVYGNPFGNGKKYFNMNHWGGSNSGGWLGCDLRYDILGSTDVPPSGYGSWASAGRVGYDPTDSCTSNPVPNTLMAALPADLRAVMKPMTKYTDNKGNYSKTEDAVTVSIDYLPLLAEFEIFGLTTYANDYEQDKQEQYEYFAEGNSTEKLKHTLTSSFGDRWGTRSVYKNDSSVFITAKSAPQYASSNADQSRLIAPIFKV